MAYVEVKHKQNLSEQEYQGLSTDVKPGLTPAYSGSTAYEVDTGKAFLWHNNQWYPV